MNFSDQPPSKQWLALKFRGTPFAEVWFKPEGQPLGLKFRIPRESFAIAGIGELLTTENLLKAVGIAPEEVDSADLGSPLPPPPPDSAYLNLTINLKSPSEDVTNDRSASEISETRWQDLAARWNTILGLEASIDTLRISIESLKSEMEASSSRVLTLDEKLNALNSDVAQLSKAKSRVLYALPKLRDFIHRSTWAAGTPERKKLEELAKNHIQTRIPFAEVDEVAEQLENLLKDRQVLSAQGTSVYQECKSISAELQGVLRTLQSNAAANANKKRGATNKKGKFF